MSRSIEDLLIWGELCNVRYKSTDMTCVRNEHQEDTSHRAENGFEWPRLQGSTDECRQV
jgi:hypothetical protein